MNRSEERKKWKKEFSAGGVVFKGNEVLLVRTASGDPARGLKEVWTFPKGWIGDHGKESVEEAALREVREEGGVEARIEKDLGEINYVFVWEGVNIAKTVRHFLMEYVSGNIADHDHEVAEVRFVAPEEARTMLAYKTDKEVLAKAEAIRSLKNHGDPD